MINNILLVSGIQKVIQSYTYLLFRFFSHLGCYIDSDGKDLPAVHKEPAFDPWVGKSPWRREWQPTPVFLLGECHGQRSLVGYSLWGFKDLDTTKHTHAFFFRFFSHLDCYIILSIVPCTIQ